jgi:pilus assembly protein CpaB
MRRPIIFVLLAGVAALVAALVVYSALKKREAEVQQAMVKNVEIVVANHDLSIDTKLDAGSVKLVRWSREAVPPGAYTDPGSVMNQYTKTSFVQNEPIVADRLFAGDKNAGVLPLLIPSGMRAMSVPVDEVSDIAGFVLPHTRVDVLVAVSSGGSNGDKPFSKIVLQNVEVLAIAQDIEQVGDKAQPVKVVTLLVSPEEAERLALASREGTLRLAMRNYDDTKIVMTSGVDVSQMLRSYGGPQPAMPMMEAQHVERPIVRAPRANPIEVEVLRNGKSTENISFIRSDGSSHQAPAEAPPSGSSSEADSPDKVADAAPAPAPLRHTHAAHSAPASATTTSSASDVAPPGSSGHTLGVIGVPAPMDDPGPNGFNKPHSKTIDVP